MRYCSICPWLSRTCKSGARIFLLDSVPCLPPASLTAFSRAASIMDDSQQQCCPLTDTFEVRSHTTATNPPRGNRTTANPNFTHGTARRRKNDGPPMWVARRSSFGLRCEKEKQLMGEKNGINDVNHAIRLVDIRDRDFGDAALFVGQHDGLALQARRKRAAANGL